MRFRDFKGQEELASKLVQELRNGRPAHAYLLHGPAGSGHLAVAWAFASYLFCQEPGEDACGSCSSCRRIASLSHPDLHFSFPFIKKAGQRENSEGLQADWRETLLQNPFLSLEQWLRATGEENKQGVIPVAESEHIVERLSLKAYEGGKKLMIIWMAEKLNTDAANKLLKILEEPPSDTIFLLLSEDASAILPTIRSRTRIAALRPLGDEALVENLQARGGLDEEAARRVAGPADGNLAIAMEMAEEEASNEYFQAFAEWMRSCFKGSIPEGLEWVEGISKKGREWHKGFLVYGLHMLRQCMVHNLVDASGVRLSEEEKAFEDKFRHYVPEGILPGMSEALEEACTDIERNGNPRIVFFDLTLRIIRQLSEGTQKTREQGGA